MFPTIIHYHSQHSFTENHSFYQLVQQSFILSNCASRTNSWLWPKVLWFQKPKEQIRLCASRVKQVVGGGHCCHTIIDTHIGIINHTAASRVCKKSLRTTELVLFLFLLKGLYIDISCGCERAFGELHIRFYLWSQWSLFCTLFY